MKQRKYLAYLHYLGFTQNDLRKFCSKDEINAKHIYEKIINGSLESLGFDIEKQRKILEKYKKFQEKIIDTVLSEREVKILLEHDEIYPEGLREIPHSPYMLYIRGELLKYDMFAVVGSRNMSNYGKSVIEKIIPDIAKIFTIVSGGAFGCDTQAHRTAIDSGGKTISVIGTGIDIDYPQKNKNFFQEIIDTGGAVISIFPIGEKAMPYNFPIRNEIVVGLSRGVLIVEAKQKSGTLITAGLCLDMGRDLFAIPGDICRNSHVGANNLIKNGEAKCVLQSQDILEEYDILLKKSVHSSQLPLLTEIEKLVYYEIYNEEISIDDLVLKLNKPSFELSATASMLELKGLIRKQLSGKFQLC